MINYIITNIYNWNTSSNTNNITNNNYILCIMLPIIEINVHNKEKCCWHFN